MPERLKTPEAKLQFRGFVEAVFASRSVQAIRDHLAQLAVPLPFRLRIDVVYLPEGEAETLGLLGAIPELTRLSETAPGFRLDGTVGRNVVREKSVPFALLPTAEDRVRAVVSVAERDDWQFLMRFLRRQYPRIVPIYLSQKELIDGVRRLRDTADNFDVRVRELTAREGLGPAKPAKSVRQWTDEALKAVLADVLDRRQSLNSLRLGFYRKIDERVDITPSASVKVTKISHVEVSGQFLLAWTTVVEHVAAVGARKLTFFANRSLRDRHFRAAPLRIRFAKPVFGEPKEVRELAGLLRKYPHSMHSVQHGNPYLHMRVADTYDGSALDVWAVSADSVVLVPRLKASEAAIGRLVHYVFDMFREGEIVEFQPD